MTTDLVVRDSDGLAEVEAAAVAAVEAIEAVGTPEAAEELLRRITAYQQAVRLAQIGQEQERRWCGIRLQAERKMGELLGPADRSAHVAEARGVSVGDTSSHAERVAVSKARKVAAVPEEVFTEYIQTAEKPTRAGLLRAASDEPAAAPPEPESTYTFLTELRFQHDARDQAQAEQWAKRLVERVAGAGGICVRRNTKCVSTARTTART